LFSSRPFAEYAVRAGIKGLEWDLLIAYLLHLVEVIRPSEGLAANRELLEAVSARG
jgi:hypothetical protein